jgi:hypothetical protein
MSRGNAQSVRQARYMQFMPHIFRPGYSGIPRITSGGSADCSGMQMIIKNHCFFVALAFIMKVIGRLSHE